MKPPHPDLLLLALLTLPPGAQAQPPCPDGTYNCIGEGNELRRKESIERLRAACLPQLEEVSRAFLKSLLPATELTNLSLSEDGGAISPSQSFNAYMDAECANKDLCDTATVAMKLPLENSPSRCKPTETHLLTLSWSGAALWRDLQKDNPQVKLHAPSARLFGIKAKRLRLKALLAKLRASKEYETEEDSSVGCGIKPDDTETTCFAVGLISKESQDREHNLTFDIQKKQGKWELVPNSLSFQ
jgi:hypothetical protein